MNQAAKIAGMADPVGRDNPTLTSKQLGLLALYFLLVYPFVVGIAAAVSYRVFGIPDLREIPEYYIAFAGSFIWTWITANRMRQRNALVAGLSPVSGDAEATPSGRPQGPISRTPDNSGGILQGSPPGDRSSGSGRFYSARMASSDLELLEHPNESAPTTGLVVAGRSLTISESVGTWVRVSTSWGVGGWVEGEHLGLAAAPDHLQVRQHPNEDAQLVGTVPTGTLLMRLGSLGAWTQVETSEGAVGWIARSPKVSWPPVPESAIPAQTQRDDPQLLAPTANVDHGSGALLAWAVVGVIAVILVTLVVMDQNRESSSAPTATTTGAAVGGAEVSTTTTLAEPVRYISTDGSPLDPKYSLIDLMLEDRASPGMAARTIADLLGPPSEYTAGDVVGSVSAWSLPGPAGLSVQDAWSISFSCAPDGLTRFLIIDGIEVCGSTVADVQAVLGPAQWDMDQGGSGWTDLGISSLAWVDCGYDFSPTEVLISLSVRSDGFTAAPPSDVSIMDIIDGGWVGSCGFIFGH